MKFTAVIYSARPNWYIWIRTISGRILKRDMPCTDPVFIDWTRAHCLLVLSKTGRAQVLSSLGEKISEVLFDSQMSDVHECRTFATSRGDSGIAVMDVDGQVSVVNSVSEPVIWNMRPRMLEEFIVLRILNTRYFSLFRTSHCMGSIPTTFPIDSYPTYLWSSFFDGMSRRISYCSKSCIRLGGCKHEICEMCGRWCSQ